MRKFDPNVEKNPWVRMRKLFPHRGRDNWQLGDLDHFNFSTRRDMLTENDRSLPIVYKKTDGPYGRFLRTDIFDSLRLHVGQDLLCHFCDSDASEKTYPSPESFLRRNTSNMEAALSALSEIAAFVLTEKPAGLGSKTKQTANDKSDIDATRILLLRVKNKLEKLSQESSRSFFPSTSIVENVHCTDALALFLPGIEQEIETFKNSFPETTAEDNIKIIVQMVDKIETLSTFNKSMMENARYAYSRDLKILFADRKFITDSLKGQELLVENHLKTLENYKDTPLTKNLYIRLRIFGDQLKNKLANEYKRISLQRKTKSKVDEIEGYLLRSDLSDLVKSMIEDLKNYLSCETRSYENVIKSLYKGRNSYFAYDPTDVGGEK